MQKQLNILAVEDSEDDALLLLREIKKGGYDPTFVRVENAGDMLACLNDRNWDIVISDYSLPEFSAPQALKVLQGTGLDLPFIVMSGKVENEIAVEVLTAGAHDFVRKDNMTRLLPAIERELDNSSVRKERKQAEEALKESEEEFRALYSAMNEGVAMHEIIYGEAGEPVDYRILNVNPAFEIITGIKREDAIGTKASELYGTDEAPYLDIYAKIAVSGTSTTFESTFEQMEKSFKISAFSPEKDKFATLFADVTEHKQAEESLKEKMRLTQILMDAMPCVALLLRPFSREIIASNKAAVEIGAVPGKQCFRTWGKSEKPCPWCTASQLWDTGQEQHSEVEGLGVVWDAHWIPVSEDMYMHYAFDITERKQAEEQMQLNEMRLEALVDLDQMTDSSFSDVAHFVLEKIVLLTKSEYGFVGLMNEDESVFTIHSWAKGGMDIYAADDKSINVHTENAGIWSDVVRQRKAIIVNDYSDPKIHKAGLPEGHLQLSSIMTIPTFENGKIVAIATVANKKTNYDDSDVHQITLLMDGMWKLVQRKRSDEKLKQAATEWAITFDSITDPVSIQDRDFKLVRVNKAYANAMNAKPDDLIGKFCYNVVHGTDECIPNCPHKQSLETKQPSIIEVFESRLGKYIEISTSPIFDENYEVSGSVHTIKDITERKAAEEEKRNFLVERTRTQLQNFVVSALPVFASGTTPQTRNILVSKFSQ
ncbi:MAG: GAF domain-containing protein, partial [Desulfobacterales bacterium]|nr:GAF domain-containing protein [Desulfobacterales bacterium]